MCFTDNGRHLELGCKRPYLDSPSSVSEEHYFRSPPSYESPLLSHPYCPDALSSREACMYGSVEPESGGGPADSDDLTNAPSSLNCNVWMQPYPRYSVEGVPYQPFSAHFTNAASVVPHPTPSITSRSQAESGVYGPAQVQRGLPVLPPPQSSSSSCSSGSRDRPLFHKKPGSPVRPHREFTGYSSQGAVSFRDPSYQYQVGLNSWTDS